MGFDSPAGGKRLLMLLKIGSQRIHEAYYEPLRKIAMGFKVFCEDYYISHNAPYPDDEGFWLLYMEDLARKEKLHSA